MFYKVGTVIFLILLALGIKKLSDLFDVLYTLTGNIKEIGEKYLEDK